MLEIKMAWLPFWSRLVWEAAMILFSAVWDATLQRRTLAFVGVIALILLAYLGALAAGVPAIRLIL
jgi:hypothetical protein